MSTPSSITLAYENNNDVNRQKMKCPSVVSSEFSQTPKRHRSLWYKFYGKIHLNSLWSLWYGFFAVILQAYVGVKCTKRILGYSLLDWPNISSIPTTELNISLVLTGLAVLALPFFLISASFKIGNLANDGFKLGLQLSTCSKDPPSELLGTYGRCSLWKHGGPTAPFLHLVISFCLLLPKLLMEARLIENGLIPQESIWHTDLDFMMVQKDRLVVLSFMTTPNNGTITRPVSPPSALPVSTSDAVSSSGSSNDADALTTTIVKNLRTLIGHDSNLNSHKYNNVDTGWGMPISLEYMNFALSLLVYSVRYSSIFWATNKCLGITFSFQMLINGIQILFTYCGMSVLYKVQILGAWKSLPLLKPQPGGLSPLGGVSPFLLNPPVTLIFYILSSIVVVSSSLILYLYGYTRFNAFLNQERERRIIVFKEGSSTKWSYFTHCAALCVLLSISVCNGPLLHDYIVVYKGSLDATILSCVIESVLHVFIWVVLWLFLTIKQKWIFKLRVTVGKATVKQQRSVKLVTDVDLMTHSSDDPSFQPLLIVGNGRTYSVSETSPKKAIMGIIQKITLHKKFEDGSAISDDGEEEIYWLKPALVSPKTSPDAAKQLCWCAKKPKQVTFEDQISTSVARGSKGGRRLPGAEVDDGDYATLRELPLPPPPALDAGDDSTSEEGKLLACVRDERVTYASTSQDLIPPIDFQDPSPLLTPEPRTDDEETRESCSVTVHSQVGLGQTPRCLRRADSGMPHEELTPRSDSTSTESPSPPDHSESSSGVHSNDSSEHHHHHHEPLTQHPQRAISIADLAHSNIKEEVQWRSGSLQRNVQPPPCNNHHQSSTTYMLTSSPPSSLGNSDGVDHGIAAVLLENPSESTVVIRRKANRPKTSEIGPGVVIKEEPFGRATNMRMTSFMENSDLKGAQVSSATLPHYPTQAIPIPNIYPHCSTMPLPQQHNNSSVAGNNLSTGNSCNIYPRMHTTIPIHHNGVRLFNGMPTPNPYIKRLQYQNVQQQNNSSRLNTNEPIYTGINRVSGEIYHYNS